MKRADQEFLAGRKGKSSRVGFYAFPIRGREVGRMSTVAMKADTNTHARMCTSRCCILADRANPAAHRSYGGDTVGHTHSGAERWLRLPLMVAAANVSSGVT